MDKTSKLFLREQIRRIRNLNTRLEYGDFIMEQLSPEIDKALESIKKLLKDKLSSKTGVYAGGAGTGIEYVDNYVDKILVNDVLKNTEKKFCGRGGMVKCVDLLKGFYDEFDKLENLTVFDSVTEKHNVLVKELESHKPFEIASKLKVELLPLTLEGGQLDMFIKFYDEVKNDLINYKVVSSFDTFMETIKETVQKGTFCKNLGKKCITYDQQEDVRTNHIDHIKSKIEEHKKLYNIIDGFIQTLWSKKEEIMDHENINEAELDGFIDNIESVLKSSGFLKWDKLGGIFSGVEVGEINSQTGVFQIKINADEVKELLSKYLRKLTQSRLTQSDIAKLMKYFDTNIAPRLLKIMGGHEQYKRNIADIKEQLREEFSEASFCETCKTREEIIDKAKKVMKKFLMIGSKLPKGKSNFDFLQSKLDDLLVVNKGETTDSTEEGEETTISVDNLKEFAADPNKRFDIKFIPGTDMKNKLSQFIDANKKGLSGNFLKHNPSAGYIEFRAFDRGKNENLQFVIFGVDKGLSYPKTYKKVVVKYKDNNGKWVDKFPGQGKFSMKIDDITKK